MTEKKSGRGLELTLEILVEGLEKLNKRVNDLAHGSQAAHRAPKVRLTVADIKDQQFGATWLRPGYDEDEVDAFLDRVIFAMEERDTEIDKLTARLAVLEAQIGE